MSKFIDITGQRFGNIIITKRVENNKDGRAQFEYLCDCGNKKIAAGTDIRNGKIISCGCKKKERLSKTKIDITGKQYNDLTAIRYDHTSSSGATVWLFKCKCGKETLKRKNDVINGKTTNCGCRTSLLKGQAKRIKEEPGAIYNFLQVLESATEEDEKGDTYYWYKCLLCGKKIKLPISYVRSGNTKSCGCLTSYKEKEIEQFLSTQRINYKTQYTFPDLLSDKKSKLRFDFALLDNNNNLLGLIEYQGTQHFDNKCGNFGKLQREVTDKQKINYCSKNNIPLLILDKNNNLKKDIISFYNEVM